jgi:serine/threonine protein phosphatase PrpC/predicted Ser/Thr protein kinase
MRLSHFAQSSSGPKRQKNEDAFAYWESGDDEVRRRQGAIAVVADGVGGSKSGEVASKMAVDIALAIFQDTDPRTPTKQLLKEIFDRANLAIYEAGMKDPSGGRMATTLSVCIFRDKELAIGHVGDSRVYLVRNEEIRRLTDDHSYTGLQLKLRLITEHEARASHLRSMLTRSVGPEPIVRMDFKRLKLASHDRILQCTDGLYCFINDGEISEGVDRLNMDEICPYLIALCERRGTDDNLTAQVVQIDRLSEPLYNTSISFLKTSPHGPETHMHNEVQVGDVLDNRFRIDEVVSRSGMASIYKGHDLLTEETVAVKVPHMQFESDPGSFARFQREAEIGKRLNHPNILRFINVTKQSRPYIVMEYLEGRTLSSVMNEVRPIPIPDAVQIASALCDALAHMHEQGIVHRDLKPQNIMICDDGSIRIMDFGIAKATEMRRITFAGFSPAMGTPDYMAPEQVKGRRGDERTDIYSLGAMLYEMTTGRVPFEGPNPFIVMNSRITGDPIAPRKVNPKISLELEEIILHAMEREPSRRYPSAAAMKAELDDPESVKGTDRHKHLQSPKVWKTRWQGVRLVVISAAVPIVVFVVALIVTHCHR